MTRWEDERYVRLYTRDTGNWIMLPWQSRCLLPLLLRKLDRAGNLQVFEGEEAAALAALLSLPLEVVEPGLEALVKRKTVVIGGGKLGMPNFLEAQEAKASDKERQRRRREKAALEIQPGVTLRDSPSRDVRKRHDETNAATEREESSRIVTPCLAVPTRTVHTMKQTRSGSRSPEESDRRRALEKALIEDYQRLRPGEQYLHGGAKDTKALNALMAAVADDEAISARWRQGLSRSPKEWASCSTFAELARKWTALAAPQTSNNKGPIDPATQHHKEGAIEL